MRHVVSTKTWAGVAPLPVLPRPNPLRADVATEWGVRHQYRTEWDHVDVRGSEESARAWHHALLFCGNYDAQLVARAAGADAAWISLGGA
jgi:hypothetical protein